MSSTCIKRSKTMTTVCKNIQLIDLPVDIINYIILNYLPFKELYYFAKITRKTLVLSELKYILDYTNFNNDCYYEKVNEIDTIIHKYLKYERFNTDINTLQLLYISMLQNHIVFKVFNKLDIYRRIYNLLNILLSSANVITEASTIFLIKNKNKINIYGYNLNYDNYIFNILSSIKINNNTNFQFQRDIDYNNTYYCNNRFKIYRQNILILQCPSFKCEESTQIIPYMEYTDLTVNLYTSISLQFTNDIDYLDIEIEKLSVNNRINGNILHIQRNIFDDE
jgi:hypothetical protein